LNLGQHRNIAARNVTARDIPDGLPPACAYSSSWSLWNGCVTIQRLSIGVSPFPSDSGTLLMSAFHEGDREAGAALADRSRQPCPRTLPGTGQGASFGTREQVPKALSGRRGRTGTARENRPQTSRCVEMKICKTCEERVRQLGCSRRTAASCWSWAQRLLREEWTGTPRDEQ